MNQWVTLAKSLFPFMPEGFITAFALSYADFADSPNSLDLTFASLRSNPQYNVWFPGNLAEDGSVHISELNYHPTINQYRAQVAELGVNPDAFSEDQYAQLISGDVTPSTFQQRLSKSANAVLSRSEEFKAFYAAQYGIEPTDTAILESYFTGTGDAIAKQVGIATVDFEAETRGLDMSQTLAAALYDAGVKTQGQAAELFNNASGAIPLFSQLAQRHHDPGDPFDLGSYLAASVFGDQEAVNRMNRLLSEERSLFSNDRVLAERAGSIVGLSAQ